MATGNVRLRTGGKEKAGSDGENQGGDLPHIPAPSEEEEVRERERATSPQEAAEAMSPGFHLSQNVKEHSHKSLRL